MPAPGKFITLEGSEGVGKTSNLDAIRRELEARGTEVVVTREPGGTPLAEDIRGLLLAVREEAVAPLTETLLMFAARAQHVTSVVRPALEAGRWVLSDRFTDASRAYQGGGRGVDSAVIEALAQMTHDGLEPDLTFYLDVGVDTAFARIRDRDHDRFEREQGEFFERVRSAYLALAKVHGRFRVIDASQPLATVESDILGALREFLDR
ncbi:MAG: dTMP kinase [Gammaproteobacteria bacterium]|nr:dTMP kinase [Gammaproteobacteria bacterium]